MPYFIYLDQNKWIDIACCYVGKKGYEKYSEVCKKIYEKANTGEWIFPLSTIHLFETITRNDQQSKLDIAKVMGELSKNYTISSHLDMKSHEFNNLIKKLVGNDPDDLSSLALKKDFLNIVGLSDDKSISKIVQPNVMPAAKGIIHSYNIFYELMKAGILDANNSEIIKDKIFYKECFEKMREGYDKIPDKYNEYKYRFFLVQQFFETFHDRILENRELFDENLDNILNKGKDEVLEFLESMPSFTTQFLLSFKIVSNKGRQFDLNDFHDIIFLSTAIPYCDVVITEKMWTGIIINSGLHKRYNTHVSKDLNHLLNI